MDRFRGSCRSLCGSSLIYFPCFFHLSLQQRSVLNLLLLLRLFLRAGLSRRFYWLALFLIMVGEHFCLRFFDNHFLLDNNNLLLLLGRLIICCRGCR